MDEYKNIAKRILSIRIYNCKHKFDLTPQPISRKNFCNYCSKLKANLDFNSEPLLYLNLQMAKDYSYEREQKSFEKKVSEIEKRVEWRHSKNPILRKLSKIKF